MSEAFLSTIHGPSPRRRIVTRLATVGLVLIVVAIVALVLVQMRFAQQNTATDGGEIDGAEIYVLQIAYAVAPGILAGGLVCLALAFAAAALPIGFGVPATVGDERDDESGPETIGPPAVPPFPASADPPVAGAPETYDPASFRRPPSSY